MSWCSCLFIFVYVCIKIVCLFACVFLFIGAKFEDFVIEELCPWVRYLKNLKGFFPFCLKELDFWCGLDLGLAWFIRRFVISTSEFFFLECVYLSLRNGIENPIILLPLGVNCWSTLNSCVVEPSASLFFFLLSVQQFLLHALEMAINCRGRKLGAHICVHR